MERIKHTFKKLTIRKSFALLILLFLLLDIFLCLATAGLLQLLPEKYYALSSPLIVCLYSALCLAAAAYLFYKCKLEEPVRLIKEAAARIGRQDLDFRLSYDSADEMGELCLSVESMRLALEDNYHLLWSQAEEKSALTPPLPTICARRSPLSRATWNSRSCPQAACLTKICRSRPQ